MLETEGCPNATHGCYDLCSEWSGRNLIHTRSQELNRVWPSIRAVPSNVESSKPSPASRPTR